MDSKSLTRQLIVGVGILCCLKVAAAAPPGPMDPTPGIPDSLKTVPVPRACGTEGGRRVRLFCTDPVDADPNGDPACKFASPAAVNCFIVNKTKAIELGKALFWDTAIGSDGQACASCHFSAGADPRNKNQMNPGSNHGDNRDFSVFRTGKKSGPNHTLERCDFPFQKFSNPDIRTETPLFNTDDVASSVGTFDGTFLVPTVSFDV